MKKITRFIAILLTFVLAVTLTFPVQALEKAGSVDTTLDILADISYDDTVNVADSILMLQLIASKIITF